MRAEVPGKVFEDWKSIDDCRLGPLPVSLPAPSGKHEACS